jgi:hypothetical protein
VAGTGGDQRTYRIFMRWRWKDNSNIDFRDMGYVDGREMGLAQDCVSWLALVLIVLNLWVLCQLTPLSRFLKRLTVTQLVKKVLLPWTFLVSLKVVHIKFIALLCCVVGREIFFRLIFTLTLSMINFI